jgi:hypothetical protein
MRRSPGTEFLHRIQTQYLPLYFPEAERFLDGTRSECFFAFLDRFPVPAAITAPRKEVFAQAPGTSSAARSPRLAYSAT